MTEKTPQEQSALEKLGEAALAVVDEWRDNPSRKLSAIECKAYEAGKNYLATQAPPRECRPDASAKDGDLFWLVHQDGRHKLRQWSRHSGNMLWTFPEGSCAQTIDQASAEGWTVDSPCIFPGDRDLTECAPKLRELTAEKRKALWIQYGHFNIDPGDSSIDKFARAIISYVDPSRPTDGEG